MGDDVEQQEQYESSKLPLCLEQLLKEQLTHVERILHESAQRILDVAQEHVVEVSLLEAEVITLRDTNGRVTEKRREGTAAWANIANWSTQSPDAVETLASETDAPDREVGNASKDEGHISFFPPDIPGSVEFTKIMPSHDVPTHRPALPAPELTRTSSREGRPSVGFGEEKTTIDKGHSWCRRGSSSFLQSIADDDEDSGLGPKPSTHFIDAEQMKSQVRETLLRPKRNASSFYKKEGWSQAVARSSTFEQLTLLVVVINSLYIAIETDFNDSHVLYKAHWSFIVAENLFCALFVLEWLIRFVAFSQKKDILEDRWYIFDSILVITMVIETWVLPPLLLLASDGSNNGGDTVNASVLRVVRLLRLSRMARVARVLRAMPELLILIKALLAAMRSVFFTLLLLLIVLYIFGIAFTQLTAGDPVGEALTGGEDMFSSVPASMYHLLLFGVLSLDFLVDISRDLTEVHWILPILLFVFVLVAALTVMNMLIGVLCEVVSVVAAIEKEALLVNYTKSKVQAVVKDIDSDGDNKISKDEFVAILSSKHACRALHDVGVDVVGLIDFADSIFYDAIEQQETHLTLESFMEVVLKLRSSNSATVKDIFSLNRVFMKTCSKLDRSIEDLKEALAIQPSSPIGSPIVRSPTRSHSSKRRGTTTPRTVTTFGNLWG